MSLLREIWKHQRLEPQQFIPVGEDRVVVAMRMVSVGTGDIETVAHSAAVWTLHAGRIVRVKAFQSKADALQAVGLSD